MLSSNLIDWLLILAAWEERQKESFRYVETIPQRRTLVSKGRFQQCPTNPVRL